MATRARRAAISLAIFACAALATGAGHGSRLRTRGTSTSAIGYRSLPTVQLVAAPVPTSPAATSSAVTSTSSTGTSGATGTAGATTTTAVTGSSALDLVGGLRSHGTTHVSVSSPVPASATQAASTTATTPTTATTVVTTSSTSDKAKAPATPTPAFPPLTGGTPPPLPPPTGFGFDTCEAPSVEAMAAWKAASPYKFIGIYVGGPSRNCPNVALRTPAWLNAVKQQGWSVIPTYVGPQAPCSDFRARMFPANYFAQGMGAADEAIAESRAAGLTDGSAIYLDMEAYPAGNAACDAAVRDFVSGWSQRMRGLGWVPGVYGSLYSAISNANATKHASTPAGPDAVWVAAWTGLGNILGFPPSALADDVWSSHARIHQYAGDHPETWGGVTMRIDSDTIDGPVGK